jgi:DNA-binding NarL/FixJ family response regulator
MVAWAVVASAVDVEAALLAGSRGVDLVLELRVDARERSAFLDDLSRIVEVREFVEPRVAEVLSGDERAVLEGLAHGQTLTDVAAALGMSRRTATRRLTSAKAALGVRTTAEALAVVGRTDVR